MNICISCSRPISVPEVIMRRRWCMFTLFCWGIQQERPHRERYCTGSRCIL